MSAPQRGEHTTAEPDSPLRLGLAGNWQQFVILVVVNAFVGAMAGLERAAMPLLAGVVADSLGISVAISVIGVITIGSGLLFWSQFSEPAGGAQRT